MWIKILCLVLIVSAVCGGQFLSHLYGKNGHNYMLICLKATKWNRERACPGALLNYDLVGVSAGCLKRHPQKRMVALRPIYGEHCQDVTDGKEPCASSFACLNTWIISEPLHIINISLIHLGNSEVQVRNVWDHIYHPWMDFALVVLDRPYYNLDVYPNSTAWTLSRTFRKHG